ncbi:MAG: peptidylprolyl isomerase [Candidatus Neomarinimicrobiota bacterium]|nr:peptidylprolyl isomerase [Candidatus Neomarinimicrobiota bacterium]
MMKHIFSPLPFLPVFIILCMHSCERSMMNPIAIINDEVITINTYIIKYKEFLHKTNLQDNLANRFALLHSLIDERLIVDYIDRNHSDQIPIYNKHKQRIYDQLLLNEYFDFTIGKQMEATDEELRTLFAWSKTTLHVRHLYAKDFNDITQIQYALENGKPWEKCAAMTFKDSLLQSNGGDLGWIRMGNMDPAFEYAAFQLEDMQISSPVKTQYGYSIIQILEKEKDVFLTEQEFQLEKNWLQLIAGQYKKMPLIREITDGFVQDMEINFNEDGLREFFLAIIEHKESQNIYSNRPLVSFKNGNYWTAKQTYEKLDNLSPRQYKRINNMDNLTNIIRGLAAREKMLLHAEKLELSTHTRFTELLERHYHGYLVNQCLEKLFNQNEQLHQNPDLKQSIYKDFRNELAENALISIDSSMVQKFILPVGESS